MWGFTPMKNVLTPGNRDGMFERRPEGLTMSERQGSERPNLAARAERWSASHWKTAVFGWLALAILLMVVGSAAGTKKLADSQTGSGETARAQKLLEDANFKTPAG